jgi:hypothetical protein
MPKVTNTSKDLGWRGWDAGDARSPGGAAVSIAPGQTVEVSDACARQLCADHPHLVLAQPGKVGPGPTLTAEAPPTITDGAAPPAAEEDEPSPLPEPDPDADAGSEEAPVKKKTKKGK